MILSTILNIKTSQINDMQKKLIEIRDTSLENSIMLQNKNKDLLERQDYEIYLATLKERNRIAREIHDNVGHLLSRSILQLAAMLAVNKDPDNKENLESLNETLNSAMTSIRQSVHNLHDESIDMQQAITEIMNKMSDEYKVSLIFDINNNISSSIKFCFISTVKEAMSNIIKHSNCTSIKVSVLEHPAFYQLSIEDDGTILMKNNRNGIGLIGMNDRVEKLDGIFRTTFDDGFKIFISIPKSS